MARKRRRSQRRNKLSQSSLLWNFRLKVCLHVYIAPLHSILDSKRNRNQRRGFGISCEKGNLMSWFPLVCVSVSVLGKPCNVGINDSCIWDCMQRSSSCKNFVLKPECLQSGTFQLRTITGAVKLQSKYPLQRRYLNNRLLVLLMAVKEWKSLCMKSTSP